MDWVAKFLEWTKTQRCRVCGASLGNARVVLVRQGGARWRADLRCAACRAVRVAEVNEAA